MGMTLTRSSGNMSSVAVRAFLSELIVEVMGLISGRVSLQQIVQHGGVVCSGYMSHNRLSGILCKNTHQVRECCRCRCA